MNRMLIAVLCATFAVQGFGEFKTVKIEVSNGGAIVAVDPVQLFQKMKALASTEKSSYVEYLVFPPKGYNVLASREEGAPDVAVQKVVIEEQKEDVGIFEAAGLSIKKNAWAWAAGTVAAGLGVYAIGNEYGWWTRSSNDDGPSSPPQIINNGGVIIIAGDGSPVSVDTSTSTTSRDTTTTDDHSNPDPVVP